MLARVKKDFATFRNNFKTHAWIKHWERKQDGH